MHPGLAPDFLGSSLEQRSAFMLSFVSGDLCFVSDLWFYTTKTLNVELFELNVLFYSGVAFFLS